MITEILKILGVSTLSLLGLFLLTKLMGRKQMSELSMFDYIVGISIGSIAAELATNIEEFEKPLAAMIVYAVIALIISIIDSKFFGAQKVISGLPLILYEDGRIFENALSKAKLSVNDLLSQARLQGYFNIGDVKVAILEPNGKISFLSLSDRRPVNPADMSMVPKQDELPVTVILDGKIINNNLSESAIDKAELDKELKKQNINDISKIILATCDSEKNLSVYTR